MATNLEHCHSLNIKPPSAGLKPLFLPTAFSPHLPSTPEIGPITLLNHHYTRKFSSVWIRQSSFSASTTSFIGSSTSFSRLSHHRQISIESSRSPFSSFDSDSVSSSDSHYSTSSINSTSSVCSSTPKPFRSPIRSSSENAAMTFPPATSVIRTSSLSDSLLPGTCMTTNSHRDQSQQNGSKRSSISYCKSSFLPLPLSSFTSVEPILFSPDPPRFESPTFHDVPEVLSPLSLPALPVPDPAFDIFLDKLLQELVQCANDFGLQDELAGIVEL